MSRRRWPTKSERIADLEAVLDELLDFATEDMLCEEGCGCGECEGCELWMRAQSVRNPGEHDRSRL